MATLHLVLGDQLSESISSLRDFDKAHDRILMAEVAAEANYVKHHQLKLVLVFSAMRHFAKHLIEAGYQVTYVTLDDPRNSGSLLSECQRFCEAYGVSDVVLTEPAEYRLFKQFYDASLQSDLSIIMREDDRFLASKRDFLTFAEGRKQLRMEYFYRQMRVRYQVLLEDDKPIGGKWNLDAENRKSIPDDIIPPKPMRFPADDITNTVKAMVAEKFSQNMGDATEFEYGVTQSHADAVLKQFITERLPQFGHYQDAMRQGDPWLFHSHISFYLNCGLLTPLTIIRQAEEAYHNGHAPLNAVEGFIRQILGWREYVRGLYWMKMPDYSALNYLRAERALPQFFWDANTEMNCLKQCVSDTVQYAYAHHIQRLMVLGNFALLAGLAPSEVNNWYLLVYADAYEWVELPNVSGMVLYADGGVLASKPYAASGTYIDKMSDYCKSCQYKVKQKNGEEACPFNYLYWDFLDRNRHFLEGNPRLGMPYRTLNRMTDEKREAIRDDSDRFFLKLENNEKV